MFATWSGETRSPGGEEKETRSSGSKVGEPVF